MACYYYSYYVKRVHFQKRKNGENVNFSYGQNMFPGIAFRDAASALDAATMLVNFKIAVLRSPPFVK